RVTPPARHPPPRTGPDLDAPPRRDEADVVRIFPEDSGRALAALIRVFGDIALAEHAEQGSDRSAGFLAKDAADLGLVDLGWGVDVVHAVRPRVPPRRGGPRSACSRSRRSWPPMRAPRRGPRPR